jgi:hypothetical protein
MKSAMPEEGAMRIDLESFHKRRDCKALDGYDSDDLMDEVCAKVAEQGRKSGEWLATQHRDGIIPPAEKIVLNCLRSLQAIPGSERLYADEMMDKIATVYLNASPNETNMRRRANALLRIAGLRT